jgi:lipoate-protein ligase A
VAVLDAIIAPALTASDLLGLQLQLMDGVARRIAPPTLVVYRLAGRIVSIGRYHLYAGPVERDGIGVMRRLTGGRVIGAGDGWIGLALIAPDQTALLTERDAHLKPEQVMNRYARGLMGAIDAFNLKCFYPGRDAITLERREIAMCTFETDSAGAMLFEAALAISRGMEDVVRDLERIDPDGQLPCAMYDADSATTLTREIGRDLESVEIARAIVAGYASQFGDVRVRELTAEEAAQSQQRSAAVISSGWLHRAIDASLKLHARIASQLGSVEARIALNPAGTVERLALAGDFIADSPGLAALERELVGARLDLPSVSRAIVKTYASGKNYFLGVGDLSNLVQLIMKAA